jgi:hypothetical protein
LTYIFYLFHFRFVRIYHDNSCKEKIIGADGVPNNVCFTVTSSLRSTKKKFFSTTVQWPYYFEYFSKDCTGTPTVTENLETLTCDYNDDSLNDDPVVAGSSDKWSYVGVGVSGAQLKVNANNLALHLLAALMMVAVQLWKN